MALIEKEMKVQRFKNLVATVEYSFLEPMLQEGISYLHLPSSREGSLLISSGI